MVWFLVAVGILLVLVVFFVMAACYVAGRTDETKD